MLNSNDFIKVILDQTALIAQLNEALNAEVTAHGTTKQAMHDMMEKMKAMQQPGDTKGAEDVPAIAE